MHRYIELRMFLKIVLLFIFYNKQFVYMKIFVS